MTKESKRAAAIFTLASLAFWVMLVLVREPCHPHQDLSCGPNTDHFSDMNVARLFTSIGLDVWRRPLESVGPLIVGDRLQELPPDLRLIGPRGPSPMWEVQGWPTEKPFTASWALYPYFSPPGALLLASPVAILYSYTGISFTASNQLLIITFLVTGHVAMYVAARSLLSLKEAAAVAILCAFIVYGEIIRWSLEGFSETLAIAPLILCGWALYKKNGLQALFFYSLAAFITFRAFHLAPLAVYAAFLIFRNKEWTGWRWRDLPTLTATALFSILSLGTFSLALPSITNTVVTNAIYVGEQGWGHPAIIAFIALVGVVTVLLVRARGWLDMTLWIFIGMGLLFTRIIYPYNAIPLLAWPLIPIIGSDPDSSAVAQIRLVGLFLLAATVFGNPLMPLWLQQVIPPQI